MMRRKRIWRVTVFFIMVAVLLFCVGLIYSSLRENDVPDLSKEWKEEPEQSIFFPNELLEVENTEHENLAGLLQEKAAGVIVRIQAGDRQGSGVIWEMNGETTLILTAAHVLTDISKVEVTLVDGSVLRYDKAEENGAKWRIVLSETADLSFLILPTEQIPVKAVFECRYAAVDKEAFDGLASGDIILVMGSGEEVAGNAYEGRLTDPWIYMEDYSRYMMLAHTYARPGMSGGGVFDRYGHLVGILSGADGKGNLAIVPLSVILTEASIL